MIQTKDMRGIILRGIERANKQHLEWTKNHWVSDYGAEGLIQVLIADEIYKAGGGDLGVFLEPNVSEFGNKSEASRLERKEIRSTARPDICTYTRDNDVPHIIEVKRKWEKAPVDQDIVRCANFVTILRNMGLEAAYCAVFLHYDGTRDTGSRRAFFSLDGEAAADAKVRVEAHLEEKARQTLSDNDYKARAIDVKAAVGEEFGFEINTDWPEEEWMVGAECDRFRWRAAVIEIVRRA
tara:strand:- start:1396 stop:2109 length:714 start_codon:yes stop_codon:yes gene_type:complete